MWHNSRKKGGIIMASKISNVVARIEPEVKAQAEEIMDELGIPVSVVINMLYKQIILKKSIPFPLSRSSVPQTLDQMDKSTFDGIMQNGERQAKNGESIFADDVFKNLEREIKNG